MAQKKHSFATLPTRTILEFLAGNIIYMTWEEYFFIFPAAKTCFEGYIFPCKQEQMFLKKSHSWKKLVVFFLSLFLKWHTVSFFSKAVCALTLYLNCSSVALPNAQSCLVLLAACTNKSERTSHLPGGRKEDLKTSSVFESVCLSIKCSVMMFLQIECVGTLSTKRLWIFPAFHPRSFKLTCLNPHERNDQRLMTLLGSMIMETLLRPR